MKDKAFTTKFVESVKGLKARQELSDPACRHLYLVVQSSGAKSWAWRGRIAGDPKIVKRTLGPFPAFSLAAAREWAQARSQSAHFGIDPEAVAAAEKAAKIVAETVVAERSTKTLKWYWDEHYAPAFVAKSRSAKTQTSMFNQLAPLHATPLVDLTIDQIEDVIDPITKRAPAQANRIAAMLKTMLRRSITHHRKITGMTSSPAEYLAKKGTEKKRDRVLSRREQVILSAVLMDPPTIAAQYADILRLCLETGCRITEAREAPWAEFDLELGEWHLPAAPSKNKCQFLIPLASETVEWLAALKAKSNHKWVFPSSKNPDKPMNSVSKCQEAIWTATSTIVAVDGGEMERWAAHDLRRTFSTGLNEIAARSEDARLNHIVIEAAINHNSGAKGGVAGRYNHYSYLAEKRLALRLWQDHLIEIRKEAKRLVDPTTTV